MDGKFMKIKEMDISTHIKECLLNAGYEKSGELIGAKDDDLLEIDDMKPSDVLEIRHTIDNYNKIEMQKQFIGGRSKRIKIFEEGDEIGVTLYFLGFLSYQFSEMIEVFFEADNSSFNDYLLRIDKIGLNGIICDTYNSLRTIDIVKSYIDFGIIKDMYKEYSDLEYSNIKELSFSMVLKNEDFEDIAKSKVFVIDCDLSKESFKLNRIVDSFESIDYHFADNYVNDGQESLDKNEKGFYLFNLYDKNAPFIKEPNQGYLSLLSAINWDDCFITYSSLVNNYEMYLKEVVKDTLSKISKRESDIISIKFGLTENSRSTFEEIGKDYRLSAGRIREIQKAALRKLRYPSRSRFLKNALYYSDDSEKDVNTVDYGNLLDELIKKEFDYYFSVENPHLENLLCKNVIKSPRFNENIEYPIKVYDYTKLFDNVDETLIIHTDLSINDKIMMIQKGLWYVSDFLDYYNIFFIDKGEKKSIMIDDSSYLSILKKYSTPLLVIKLKNVVLKAMSARNIQSFNQLSEEINSFPKSIKNDINEIYEKIKNAYDEIESIK